MIKALGRCGPSSCLEFGELGSQKRQERAEPGVHAAIIEPLNGLEKRVPLEDVQHCLSCFRWRLTRSPAFAERRPEQRARGDNVVGNGRHDVSVYVVARI